MTAASRHHSSPSPRGFLSQRLERIVLALVVCVPVPAVALSGLNVPLPSIVERAAAALVPWANVATLDTHALAAGRGSIILAAGQEADAAGSLDVEPATRQKGQPSTRAHAPRPAVTKVDGTLSLPRADLAGPDTTDRVPVAPAEPRNDDGGHESPAPAPAEPTPEPQPADQPESDLPATPPSTPSPAPTPGPTPDREPKDQDENPVDETDGTPTTPAIPAGETGVTPPDVDTNSLPDLPPLEKLPLPDVPTPRNAFASGK
jgi:hypothetical protein